MSCLVIVQVLLYRLIYRYSFATSAIEMDVSELNFHGERTSAILMEKAECFFTEYNKIFEDDRIQLEEWKGKFLLNNLP